MRNPFGKVYCEDCEYCLLSETHSGISSIRFAKCKKDANVTANYISRELESVDYHYCSTVRRYNHSFCFKFKEKDNE